jgi:hypothetical protein
MAKQIINNGETGLQTRNKLNDNFTEVYNKNESQDTTLDSHTSDIAALKAPVSTKYAPQATPPTYQEGQVYYDNVSGTFNVQGPQSDVTLRLGHGNHMHIVNNSGAEISKGLAVRSNGIAGGIIQIEKALADTFAHASVLGVTAHDIPHGEEGVIGVFGELQDVNTAGLPLGTPLYLSDTVAGTYTATKPDIASRVGGVIVADASTGKLFINIINHSQVPTTLGALKGQTPGNETYNVTTTAQDIINYSTSESVVTDAVPLTGIITLPNDGKYRVNFVASITFPSSTSTRSVTIEVYDITNTLIHFSYVKNIPRDATEDGLDFGFPIDELVGNQHKLRIKSSVAIDVTFQDISFDIESISID